METSSHVPAAGLAGRIPAPELTILICTHDRAVLLGKVLASLNTARRPSGWSVRIVVAANACSDSTHTVLDNYRTNAGKNGWLALEWFAEPTPGKSHALNSAIPRLGGEIVAFVDDDHRVDSGYLTAVCRAADMHPEAGLFCGRILPDWDGLEPAWVHDTGRYRIYPLPVPRFDQGDIARELMPDQAVPGGGNLAVRTAVAHRIGTFATDRGPTGHNLGGAEDLDWVLRGLRLGERLRYVPDMVQHHYVDTGRLTLRYLMKKAYKRTASTIDLEPRDRSAGVPRYLYRKIAGYVMRACTSLDASRRRFYLVRTAAALGEFIGHRRAKQASEPASATH